MSVLSRTLLGIGIALIVAVMIYPPWIFALRDRNMTRTRPAGYYFIFPRQSISPPEPRTAVEILKYEYEKESFGGIRPPGSFESIEIDLVRLLIQVILICAVTGGLVVIVETFRQKPGQTQEK